MPLKLHNLLICCMYAVLGIASSAIASRIDVPVVVWIPAGLAVAATLLWEYRALPGIAAGAFASYLYILLEVDELAFSVQVVCAALLMAGGIVAQSWVGALIASRILRNDSGVEQLRTSALFTCAVGPCAVTVSTLFVPVANIINGAESGDSWMAWWVGNSLGAMLTTAAFLTILSRRDQIWHGRRHIIVPPIVIMTAIVILVNTVVMRSETDRLHGRFDEEARRITSDVRVNYARYRTLLIAAQHFISASAIPPSAASFKRFVEQPLNETQGVEALAYAPYIRSTERPRFERAQTSTMPAGIQQRSPRGAFQRATIRSEYAPITYIEPNAANTRAVGFDLLSEPLRRNALVSSRDSGSIRSTERVNLVQGYPGVLIMAPIYRGGLEPTSIKQRRASVTGFISGAVRISTFVRNSTHIDSHSMNVMVRDRGAPRTNSLLFTNRLHHHQAQRPPFSHRTHLTIGGRRWDLYFTPTEHYVDQLFSTIDASLIIISLLVGLSTGTIVLFLSGQTYAVEREVRERVDQLRLTEQRTARILENAQDAFVTINQEGIVQEWNPQACLTFGWSREEAVGSLLADLIVPPSLRDRHTEALATFDPTQPSSITNRRIELPAVDRSGREFQVELTITPVVTDQVLELHAFLHDISERHLAELERQHASDLKTHFVAMASHEMRTPLTSIIGYAQTLLGRWDSLDDTQKLEFLAIIVRQGERFGQLIDDLLTITRIEDGKLTARPAHTNIRSAVIQAVTDADASADIRIDESVHAFIDGNHLQQILINLVGNAKKYGTDPIVISARKHLDTVRIDVSDAGRGVDHEFVPNLFELFSQAGYRNTSSSHGVGLGLAIVRSLCEAYGGSAGYEPNEPRGARFYVVLPESSGVHDQDN